MFFIKGFLKSFIILLLPLLVYSQKTINVTFEESSEDFANPERGFFHARELTKPQNFDIRGENLTLIYGRISADDFRDKPFSDAFLQAIQTGFDEARKQGIKVNPRVAYNSGPHPGCVAKYGDDAPKDIVLTHIAQLKPLWHKNKDVINLIDAGFIGGWGEWHNSAHGLDSLHNRREILFAILDALPKDRMVVQRTPHYKRAIFTGSEIDGDSIITKERAFDGSYLSRVGHLNDCFLSSENDVGTYAFIDQGWTVEKELEYIGTESRYVPFGGETCSMDERGKCSNAVREMEKLHINYLNLDYNPNVLNRWKEENCFEQIRRRLGYRFVLKSALIPEYINQGSSMKLTVELENKGFGELFNPRNVEIVIINNKTKSEQVAIISDDPRFWSAGEPTTVNVELSIPNTLPVGMYSLGIRLPDSAPSIHNDPRYSIRFANSNCWDDKTGTNILTNKLQVLISKSVSENNYETFSEIR
ncbi:MAG: DUF4832 domain-containing protein [Calditrichaeota bacterium]|nr:DUF4832 domain-containing protein [Calditrichota bacterium]